jgi:metal-responsive CopG/Arc/MetJ family transcriptional regulator
MAIPKEQQLVHMRVDAAMVKLLDDFRFKHRFESRTEAVRWLIKAALDAQLAPKRE